MLSVVHKESFKLTQSHTKHALPFVIHTKNSLTNKPKFHSLRY